MTRSRQDLLVTQRRDAGHEADPGEGVAADLTRAEIADAGAPSEYAGRVLHLVDRVPRGCVTTYGDIAAIVGVGTGRHVGTVLGRFGSGVPWHRVVRSDGTPHDDRAVSRLREEGIGFRGDDPVAAVVGVKVDLAAHRWIPNQRDLEAVSD